MPLSGDQIYQNFHTGRGSVGLGEAAGIVNELAGSYEGHASELEDLAGSMESVWTGAGASAAGQVASPIGREFTATAPHLHKVGQLVERQASSFDSAKSSVQYVPAPPDKPGFWDNVLTFGESAGTYEAKLAAHKAAAQHNVDVMNNYTLASEYNTSGLPGGGLGGTGIGLASSSTTTPSVPSPTGAFSGVLPLGEQAGIGVAGAGGLAAGLAADEQSSSGSRTAGSGMASTGGSRESEENNSPAGAPLGGAASGGDDEQQWASLLLDADADAVFGTDEPTAPPVIGE